MGGLDRQSQRKAEKRAVDMSNLEEELEAAVVWEKPPPSECYEQGYTTALGDFPQSAVQVKLRLVRSAITEELVEFAIIGQFRPHHSNKWFTVVEIDSTHDDESHYHQHGRGARGRIGDAVTMVAIVCANDVQDAYTQAYQHLEAGWESHVERWRNG